MAYMTMEVFVSPRPNVPVGVKGMVYIVTRSGGYWGKFKMTKDGGLGPPRSGQPIRREDVMNWDAAARALQVAVAEFLSAKET